MIATHLAVEDQQEGSLIAHLSFTGEPESTPATGLLRCPVSRHARALLELPHGIDTMVPGVIWSG